MKEKFKKLSQILLAVAAFALVVGFGKNTALAYGLKQTAQTETSITVTWDAPSLYGSNRLQSYYIGYSTDYKTARAMAENKSVPVGTNRSYTINGLVPGTEYEVCVYYTYTSSRKWNFKDTSRTGYRSKPGNVVESNPQCRYNMG